MERDKNHEKTHFFHAIEKEWVSLFAKYGPECSEECLRSMKRIYRMLRIAIYQAEVWIIERRKQEGRITPKEAVRQKAKVRKQYL